MATRKTVSSVSNSNKPNTNKESVPYLILCTDSYGGLDWDSFLVADNEDEILDTIKNNWSHSILEEDRIRIIKLSEGVLLKLKANISFTLEPASLKPDGT